MRNFKNLLLVSPGHTFAPTWLSQACSWELEMPQGERDHVLSPVTDASLGKTPGKVVPEAGEAQTENSETMLRDGTD